MHIEMMMVESALHPDVAELMFSRHLCTFLGNFMTEFLLFVKHLSDLFYSEFHLISHHSAVMG